MQSLRISNEAMSGRKRIGLHRLNKIFVRSVVRIWETYRCIYEISLFGRFKTGCRVFVPHEIRCEILRISYFVISLFFGNFGSLERSDEREEEDRLASSSQQDSEVSGEKFHFLEDSKLEHIYIYIYICGPPTSYIIGIVYVFYKVYGFSYSIRWFRFAFLSKILNIVGPSYWTSTIKKGKKGTLVFLARYSESFDKNNLHLYLHIYTSSVTSSFFDLSRDSVQTRERNFERKFFEIPIYIFKPLP